MRKGGIWVTVALALLWGALAAKEGGAADLSVVPGGNLQAQYYSNLNYDFQNQVSDFLFTINPYADFNYATEALTMQGHVGWTGLVYAKSSSADHIDQNYQITGKYTASPRVTLNLNTGYIVDSSLQEELTNAGIIMTRTPRRSIQVGPGVTYALTERLSTTASYQFRPVQYQDPNFTNYTDQLVNLSFDYRLRNERTTLSLVCQGLETDYTNNDVSQILTPYLGISHKFSEKWTINFQGGANYSSNNFSTVTLSSPVSPFFVTVNQATRRKITSLTPYFSIAATGTWERWNLTGSYINNQSASGSGAINNVNGLVLALGYNITERLTGTVSGSYYMSNAVSQSINYNNSYFQVSPQLSYQMTEHLTLSPGYGYSQREDLSAGRTAINHLGWLMVAYSYPIHYQK